MSENLNDKAPKVGDVTECFRCAGSGCSHCAGSGALHWYAYGHSEPSTAAQLLRLAARSRYAGFSEPSRRFVDARGPQYVEGGPTPS